MKTNVSYTIIWHSTGQFQNSFIFRAKYSLLMDPIKMKPVFLQKGSLRIDFSLTFTFTCFASFLTSFKRHGKALWFLRVIYLVPSVTGQERKQCTAAGEHELTQYHNLLLPHALSKSAWWIKGLIFRGSASAGGCSMNACDAVVC